MPFHSIEPRRLYRQIADQIRTLIKSGEFPAGARLPPERDLAKQLGVSRPSVREALIALEVEGLVEVRIGSGIYVQPRQRGRGARRTRRKRDRSSSCARATSSSPSAPRSPPSPRRSRRSRPSPMRSTEMQREMDVGEHHPLGGDRLFHMRIAEATGNGALVAVVKILWDERTGPLYKQLEHHYDSPALWEAAMAEHRAVLKAIVAKDAPGARAAMQRHLNQAYKRFSIGWDTLAVGESEGLRG